MKKNYELDDSKKKIKFKINTGTITIYRDNVVHPLLICPDQYEIKEKENGIKVSQNAANTISVNGVTFTSDGVTINNRGVSFVVGNNLTIVNGKIISGNIKSTDKVEVIDEDIEFVVPKDVDDLSFDVSIDSGSLIVRDILLKSMEAKLMSGDIRMNDVDMLYSKLQVTSGSIDLDICESIINYNTKLNSMSGKVEQDHIDTANNINFVERRELKASTISGNIKVLFRGK